MNIIHLINKTESNKYFYRDIYIDDTIGNIKYKLRNYLNINDIYLFIKKKFIYDAEYYQKKNNRIFERNTTDNENNPVIINFYENLSKYCIDIPLGIENNSVIFTNITNPFNILATDVIKKNEIINDDLLLMDFDGKCQEIYVCDKKDVEVYLMEINQEMLIEKYFPNYLKYKNYKNENEIVNKCYDLEPIQLYEIKITKVMFEIYPKKNMNIILSETFKNIHVNELYTYLYHSKLFKLYSMGKNLNNEKVPFMKSNKINICHKLINNYDDFCVYLNVKKNFIFFEINKNGHIWITYESEDGNDLLKIESIIKKYVNELIEIIDQNMAGFDNFYSERVKIMDINCNVLIKTDEIFINKMIFYLKNNVKMNEYELIFKRVSNYNIAYEIQDYILKNDANKIIDNYSLSLKEANEYINMNIIKKEKKDIILLLTKMLGYCNIQISNIDNIYYLNTLTFYIKSLTTNIKSSIVEYYLDQDKNQKKKKKIKNDVNDVNDINYVNDENKEVKEEEEEEEEVKEEEEEEEESSSDDDYNPYAHLLKKGGRKISYFQKRIEIRDPDLLNNKMNFSKKCALDIKRQPIALTKDEYEKNRENIDNYLEFRNNYYICPRYWSFKYGKVITEEEFKSGKYGELIDKIPENVEGLNYVYEFSTKNGYKKQYPGFIEDHGKGICMPCCFGKMQDEIKIEKMKRQCVGRKRVKKIIDIKEPPTHISNERIIKQGNWGFLPKLLQAYLNVQNKSDKIKTNVSYLLRYGVQESINQSFISCISTIMFYKSWNSKIPSIKEMRNIIINALTIDNYVSYQNSNLVSQFYDKTKKDMPALEKYQDSKIIKIYPKSYFVKIVNSFENFIKFLKSDDVVIDYTYLWDILSYPNPNLFEKGINIAIFEIVENKSGMDRINIQCPTNHEPTKLFDSNKPTIMLIKHKNENKYEPIYVYKKNQSGNIYINSLFELSLVSSEKSITDDILTNIIKPIFNYKCKPINVNNNYKYKVPIKLDEIIEKISEKKEYEIRHYVMDNFGKIVGLMVLDSINGIIGFIPCYPTNLPFDYSDKSIINMDNVLWNNYYETIIFLENWYKSGNFYKVVQGGIIIGFLTLTNQFIEIYPFIKNTNEYNKDIELDYNPNLLNKYITDNINLLDNERVINVNKIKLESKLYKIFKYQIVNYINNFYNYKIKNSIIEIVKSESSFEEKVNKISEILRPILKDKIIFIDEYDEACLKDENDLCNKSNKKIIIPKKNMIDPNQDNSINYYIKLADEIIRFKKITGMVFDNNYISDNNSFSNFIINDDEILLNMGDKYNIENYSVDVNPFVKNTTFDTVNPITNKKREEFVLNKKNDLCFMVSELNDPLINIFPKNSKKKIYYSSVNCTFKFVMLLTGIKTVNEIKKILIEKYNEPKLYDIFIKIQKIKKEEIENSVEKIIYNENFFINLLDLWIIISYCKIPCYLFSKQKIISTNAKSKLLYKDEKSEYFCFIFIDSLEIIPEYSVIMRDDENIFFNLNELDLKSKNFYTIEIKKKIERYSIEDFISFL
uniref:Uncharacterized protein n=1 Tax=viral metagenome TaxID=1070528 RepID=A0A6C0H648_9ZZZZ